MYGLKTDQIWVHTINSVYYKDDKKEILKLKNR